MQPRSRHRRNIQHGRVMGKQPINELLRQRLEGGAIKTNIKNTLPEKNLGGVDENHHFARFIDFINVPKFRQPD